MTIEEAAAYPGDHTMDEALPQIQKEPYKVQYNLYDAVVSLDRVEVQSEESSKVIVAFGDSITAMNRWVKPLNKRLLGAFEEVHTSKCRNRRQLSDLHCARFHG